MVSVPLRPHLTQVVSVPLRPHLTQVVSVPLRPHLTQVVSVPLRPPFDPGGASPTQALFDPGGVSPTQAPIPCGKHRRAPSCRVGSLRATPLGLMEHYAGALTLRTPTCPNETSTHQARAHESSAPPSAPLRYLGRGVRCGHRGRSQAALPAARCLQSTWPQADC